MVSLRKGDKYKCETCGVVMLVDTTCGCAACDLVCCGKPMKKFEAKKK